MTAQRARHVLAAAGDPTPCTGCASWTAKGASCSRCGTSNLRPPVQHDADGLRSSV